MIIAPEDYKNLRQSGRITAYVLQTLHRAIYPGMVTAELDDIARATLAACGAEAAFLGYPPDGAHPYPAAINVSVNEQIVHGIPGARRLALGDIVTLDCGSRYNGIITDAAITVPVGFTSPRMQRLIRATEHALEVAVQISRPGRRIGDIAFSIQSVLRQYGVRIPPNFGGHGVGYRLHAPPHIPNTGLPNWGPELEIGMALAIEPMGTFGGPHTRLLDDQWTVVSQDGDWCAHSEHTVLILEDGAEVVTCLPPKT
ncbi:MAG: type I methionyl aminopeptidase [Anaerolineales bacterium]